MHNSPARGGAEGHAGGITAACTTILARGERSMTWTWTASVSVLPATGTDPSPVH